MINRPNLNAIALADAILPHLKSLNLSLEKVIGQGYDGASSMPGKGKGVQAVVREYCPQAVWDGGAQWDKPFYRKLETLKDHHLLIV